MSVSQSETHCPACGEKPRYLIDWEYSGLNDSIFNYTARWFECLFCGLVFNTSLTDERLANFYAQECSYFEKTHFDISAPENIMKFKCYAQILASAGLSDTPITDVGCGRGGFLFWLKKNNWRTKCLGIDIDVKSIPRVATSGQEGNSGVDFQEGRALALPLADQSQSLLTYFHVIEHIVDLGKVFYEAARVLKTDGHIMIEVPDAERYKDYPIGTAFWIGIREHVYHFSASAICHALYRNGFEVMSINRNMLPTPEFSYPSLIIFARKGKAKESKGKSTHEDIAGFIVKSQQELKTQAQKVLEFSSKFSSVTFWGCSAELFSLLPMVNLKHFTLCDSSKGKQKCLYKGFPIIDPLHASKDGALVIAPYLFTKEIENAALKYGWPKQSIFCLQ